MYDYEELKVLYRGLDLKQGNCLDLPSVVELTCYSCQQTFTRERYRVMCRLQSGIEHAFCRKGCASSWVRIMESQDKPIIVCTYEDFLLGRMPRRDDIAYVKRPLYSIPCFQCGSSIIKPWEHFRGAVREGDKRALCSISCTALANRSPDCLDTESYFQFLGADAVLAKELRLRWNCHAMGRAARRYDFTLSRSDFYSLAVGNCFYCDKKADLCNGIDRYDNRLGYVVDNCVSCCGLCNRMKFTYTPDMFLAHVAQISAYQAKKY